MKNEAKSWEKHSSDADVSVWWLTLVRALLKEASDTVVLK
jgi:hypothetical protein